jgi:hypothetical protein
LSLKLTDILTEAECLPEKISGYLATPLTGLSDDSHRQVANVVQQVRLLAADARFNHPPFDIYWPGDYTHPQHHANLRADQVYVTDRSRASTQDFVILFCAEKSYGIGQENEIATQAGVPAIRLIPSSGISRMMLGSFLKAVDVPYGGSLQAGIVLDSEKLLVALQEMRRIHFRHQALYRGLNTTTFGARLKVLIDDRCGTDYRQLADELGISLTYLLTLMNEPFAVSNPSGRLLIRIASRLGERVAYLLGESDEMDPVWTESNAAWQRWIEGSTGIDAGIAFQLRKKWRNDYYLRRREQQLSTASYRSTAKLMKEKDWEDEYKKVSGGRTVGTSGIQGKLEV